MLSVRWPAMWTVKGYTTVTMGFETVEVARAWHAALCHSIGGLGRGVDHAADAAPESVDNAADAAPESVHCTADDTPTGLDQAANATARVKRVASALGDVDRAANAAPKSVDCVPNVSPGSVDCSFSSTDNEVGWTCVWAECVGGMCGRSV
eukprot:69478-Chlamydomonas_euryale.AAC.1